MTISHHLTGRGSKTTQGQSQVEDSVTKFKYKYHTNFCYSTLKKTNSSQQLPKQLKFEKANDKMKTVFIVFALTAYSAVGKVS